MKKLILLFLACGMLLMLVARSENGVSRTVAPVDTLEMIPVARMKSRNILAGKKMPDNNLAMKFHAQEFRRPQDSLRLYNRLSVNLRRNGTSTVSKDSADDRVPAVFKNRYEVKKH